MDVGGNQINVLEHKEDKIMRSVQQEEKRIPPNVDKLRILWDNFKCTNIRIIGVPEGEEEEQEIENLFEKIMQENFLNLGKEIDKQVQEAQGVPNKMNTKRTTPRRIRIEMSKVKDREKMFKAARKKLKVTYKGVPIRMSADFLRKMEARQVGVESTSSCTPVKA